MTDESGNEPHAALPADATLEYYRPRGKISSRGIWALILGAIGVLASPFIVGIAPGAAAVYCGCSALAKMRRDPLNYGGKGFALLGILLVLQRYKSSR